MIGSGGEQNKERLLKLSLYDYRINLKTYYRGCKHTARPCKHKIIGTDYNVSHD